MGKEIVLVIDGGGRGSALVKSYSQSEHVSRVLAAPGNNLMTDEKEKPIDIFPSIATTDIEQILKLCIAYGVTLVDIAQDNAVEAGLGDALKHAGISFVGPTRDAGQIEWDKGWSRRFQEKHQIPHPSFGIFSSVNEAFAFLDKQPDKPWVIKANGLAEGKGVYVVANREEAKQAVLEMQQFKRSGETFLIEECLVGEEFSTFIVSDGIHWKLIGSAQDHKRAFDGDKGPNTGGMGCSTPPIVLTPELMRQISDQILERTIAGMHEMGRPYTGILYLGGIILDGERKGEISTIEFNARWGDPEVECILPGLMTDLFEMSYGVAHANIRDVDVRMDGKSRVVVAACAKGYPDKKAVNAVKGKEIFGIAEARKLPAVRIYGGGVAKVEGRYYVKGGRILYVVGEGNNVPEARAHAYEAMSVISVEEDNLHYRTDIGWRDVARENKK